MKKTAILFIFSFLFARLALGSTNVPPRFHFQSVFYDTGGNPLSTGTYLGKFSILDQSYQAVYSEEQEVELINGVVSTMIGDGFEAGSNLATPTGGIARNLIDPYQTYYLQAEIEGDTRILEIGSVPYAQYSEEALSVASGAITSESILEGTIQREHLSEALEEAIFGTITGERLPESVVSRDDFQNHLNADSNAHPASAISVAGSFANANSTNVEGVLGDFDRAIELQSNNLDSAVDGLQGQINSVNTNLQNQISSVNTSLQSQINGVNSDLQSQIDRKLSVDGGSLNGTLNMQGNRIVSLSDPSGENDATTKGYVDRTVEGLRADLTVSESSGVQPQLVAAGIAEGGDRLSWGYNVSQISRCRVVFRDPIATPYVVQITAADVTAAPIVYSVRNISSEGFTATDTNFNCYSGTGSFHFVVFK